MRASDFIPCDICHEAGFRCNEHGCWKDWAVLDNSQAKPKYSPGFSAIIGITLGLGMVIGTGIYELVRHGR